MSDNTTTTTTPTKKKSGGGAQNVASQIEQIIKQDGGSILPSGGVAGNNPNISTTQGADVLNFALPNQLGDLTIPNGMATTQANGVTQMTFSNAIAWLQALQGTPELTNIQRELFNSGYYSGNKVKYGTIDTPTLDAFKRAMADAYTSNQITTSTLGKPTTLMTLLATHQGPEYVQYLTGLEQKAQAALSSAAGGQAPILNLEDSNRISQAYATAMESMGMGAPTKEQVDKFVTSFQSAQTGAEQNAYIAQENDKYGLYQQDQSAMNSLISGQAPPANAASAIGPVDVATKAMPNLDAEAIAAAQHTNPDMYYATQSSYLYGIIQKMLSGNMQQATAPTSPTSLTPSGAIVTSPIAGAP